MLNKISIFMRENKVYLLGLCGIFLVFGFILNLYCTSATQLNDGWLEIYSDMLANGGLLYKDCNFPLLPFPILLFAFLNKIFGNTLIIGHIAGAVLKLCILGLFYTVLSRFFGFRNAFCGTLVSGAVLIAIMYDCCLFSYNDLMYCVGLLATLILLIAVKNLEQNKAIYFQSLLLGLCLGLMLVSKQTHGVVLSVAALVLQAISVVRYKNLKQAFMYSCTAILPVFACVLGLFIYLYRTNTIHDFYINVIAGVSSKGNISDLIFHHFKALADSSLIWVVYFAICVFIALFTAMKNFNPAFDIHKNKYDNTLVIILSIAAGVLVSLSALLCVYHFGLYLFDMNVFRQIDKFFKQICAIGFVFTDIYVFYLFFDFLFNKSIGNKNFSFLIFLAMVFSMNYSIMLSKALTNLIFMSVGIMTAWGLQQEIPLYKLKNGCIYLFTAACLFLGTCGKIICPVVWHNWEADSIIENKKTVKNVPFLKGMKLPEKEAEFFEEIRKISDEYTTNEDKIYCFLNNQLFYGILERKPLTKNANLYFDLCSDEKALSDMEILVNNPPKLIIWLKWPEYMINFHEYLFRGGSSSGQRQINNAIANMVKNKKYKTVKIYKNKYSDFYNNYEKFITNSNDKKKLKEIRKKIKEREKVIKAEKHADYCKIYANNKEIEQLKLEQAEIITKIKKQLDIEHYRYFLPEGYELYVLVRKDVFKDKELYR